nr:S8 family peptidase [Pseudemcibacter aquimaris]
MNILTAYDNGYTGNGILVAVIDSGVTEVPELEGQLHSASTNVANLDPNDADDFSGHGTAIAGVIASKRDHNTNNSPINMHGVAFDAQILNINATTSANCPDLDNCSFFHSDLANAYDYAVQHNADIINESLGSNTFPTIGLQQAIQRAVAADKLIVQPAGNIEDTDPAGTGTEIQGSARVAIANWANGQIIVAGSVDSNNVISDFSYRAGEDAKNIYLVAPGEQFTTPDHLTNNSFEYVFTSGTSVSTALISGAAALLMQAFPNLSAAEIADILFTTATDLGVPGVDNVYGRGLVNIEEAFTAQGQLSLAGNGFGETATIGTANTVASQNLIYSGGAFGADISFRDNLSNVMVTDKYDRSYNIDFSNSVYNPQAMIDLDRFMTGAMSTRRHDIIFDEKTNVRMAWQHDDRFNEIDKRYFSNHLDRHRTNTGQLRMAISHSLDNTKSVSFTAGMSLPEMLEDYRPDDYIAPNKHGFNMLLNPAETIGVSYKNNGKTTHEIAIATSEGSIPREISQVPINFQNTMVLNRIEHHFTNNLTASFDFGLLTEKGSVLGAISTGALEIGRGARTGFVGGKFNWNITNKSNIFARVSYGLTKVDGSSTSIIDQISTLKSYSYLVGVKTNGIIRNNDQLSISFSQPLKLHGGKGIISTVSNRDYVNNNYTMSYTAVPLAPRGTERDIELAYTIAEIMGVRAQVNFLYQLNPGHVQSIPNSKNILIRLGSRF